MEDIDETTEDEDAEDLDDEDQDETPAPATAAPAEEPGSESSLEELIAKKEGGARPAPEEEEEEDDPLLSLGREERLEPLAVKVVPPQTNEFVCRNCHLVKHRSQLKDKARMFCRDCA